MARYTGPRDKISRRFGVPVFGPSKYLERKNYPPGTHGPRARRKYTDYALALMVNGGKMTIPSYTARINDVVEVKDTSGSRQLATRNLEYSTSRVVPEWLQLEKDAFKGTVLRLPTRDEIQPIADEQTIVEFYSR